jgi:hypothetical protein
MSGMSDARKGNQQFGAAEKPLRDVLGRSGTVLSNPTTDAFEIGNGLIVEYKMRAGLGAQSIEALAGFLGRQQHAVRIVEAALNLSDLRIRQTHISHMFDVVQ